MADPQFSPAQRHIWDQGIAPLAKGVQGFLKGTAGLPGAVKDYAAETLKSGHPSTKVMAEILNLAHGMREGIKEDPLRAMAEMYPPVGFGSDVFETGRLLKQAQNAEESGELEKAQTLRELANTIVLMGMVPGGPPAKKTIEQKLKDMEEKRRKLKEETGLPYVPNKEPPLPEGRRIDLNEAELDLLERERRLQQAVTVPKYEGMRDEAVEALRRKGIMSQREFEKAEWDSFDKTGNWDSMPEPEAVYIIEDSGSNSSYVTIKKPKNYAEEGMGDPDEYTIRFSDHPLPRQYGLDRNIYNVSEDYLDETIHGKSLDDALQYIDRILPKNKAAGGIVSL